MERNPIKVNGITLPEYLKDREEIETEIESKKFISEGFDQVKLTRRVRPKFSMHKEKNGKVRILGTAELNRTSFESDIRKALTENSLAKCVVIILMAHSAEKRMYTQAEVVTILKRVGAKTGIPVDPQIAGRLRPVFGRIKQSALKEHVDFMRKDKNSPSQIGIKEESRNKLKTKDAVVLTTKLSTSSKEKMKIARSLREESIKNKRLAASVPAQVKPENDKHLAASVPAQSTNPAESPAKSIVEGIVAILNKSSQDGNLFTINGDLHFHININIGSKER